MLTLITLEHKSFWQLRQLDGFTINTIAKLFVYGRLKIPEVYSEPVEYLKWSFWEKWLTAKIH